MLVLAAKDKQFVALVDCSGVAWVSISLLDCDNNSKLTLPIRTPGISPKLSTKLHW